ncbi:neuromedin-U receptor 2-like [Patiria miniata]|uniref:G-protein coupled receptors family 1 profile domain-containing protein n=1 Tax=Patiria miniata TaxID=46514 RepID=A0A914AEA5_PATMI|nr:neuromedin-U receptor 2-like [Patiria miniata]
MGSDTSTLQCDPEYTYVLTPTNASKFMYTDVQKITASYILPCILFIGLLGNSAFLFVLARVRSMRTVTNFYLANLAVADMVFLTIVVTSRVYPLAVYGVPNEVLGVGGCVADILFRYIFHFAGLLLITFMSLERYIAVCHPLRHRIISGRSCTAKLVLACWLTSSALAALLIPSSMVFKLYCVQWPEENPLPYQNFPEVIGACWGLDQPWAIPLLHLTQTIPFFVAFFGNAYFYARIVFKLHKRDSSSDRQRIIRTRNHVALMLVANGTVFFLTVTAFEVTSLILFVQKFIDDFVIIPFDIRINLFEANRVLLYLNSAVNPIVYTLTNARYRRAFRRAFRTASWGNGRGGNSTIFSAFPDYYSQYHINPGGLTPLPRLQSPAKSPMVARPATYSNACFEHDESESQNLDEDAKDRDQQSSQEEQTQNVTSHASPDECELERLTSADKTTEEQPVTGQAYQVEKQD